MAESIERARRLMQAGNLTEARRLLQHTLQRDPRNAGAWALMLHLAETPERALECAEHVLRLKPGDPWALRQRARLMAEVKGSGTPTPTLRQPQVPSQEDFHLHFVWEAVRAGVNVLVVGPNASVRRSMIDAMALAIPPDRYPVRMTSVQGAPSPSHRIPHHLMTTVDDDDTLTVLLWAHRSTALLLAGVQGESADQAISRYQFSATMRYRTADRYIQRNVVPDSIPAMFAEVFPLVVAGRQEGDETVLVDIAEPEAGHAGQMRARPLWEMTGERLRPTGLRPTWLDDYPLRLELPRLPGAIGMRTPVSQPTPRTDLSHKVLTRHNERPELSEPNGPERLGHPGPPPASPKTESGLMTVALVGAGGMLLGLLLLLIVLLST